MEKWIITDENIEEELGQETSRVYKSYLPENAKFPMSFVELVELMPSGPSRGLFENHLWKATDIEVKTIKLRRELEEVKCKN